MVPLAAYPAGRPARLPRIDSTRPLHTAERRKVGRSRHPLSALIETDITCPLPAAPRPAVIINAKVASRSKRQPRNAAKPF